MRFGLRFLLGLSLPGRLGEAEFHLGRRELRSYIESGRRLGFAALIPAPLIDLRLGQARKPREREQALLAPVRVPGELLSEHVHLSPRLPLSPPYYLLAFLLPIAQGERGDLLARDVLGLGLLDCRDLVLGAAVVPCRRGCQLLVSLYYSRSGVRHRPLLLADAAVVVILNLTFVAPLAAVVALL